MNATVRAALTGGGLALLLVAAVAALFVTGTVTIPEPEVSHDRLLVIATAPDDVSINAPFAFVLSVGESSAELLDPSARVVISGTSAETARDAYPFTGGQGVARALAVQTGGDVLPWVVLPPDVWARIVDDFGGIEVELPTSISAYRDGELVVIDGGRSRLSGMQAVGLASSLEYISDKAEREQVRSQLSAGVSAVVAARQGVLAELVLAGSAQSSADRATLSRFTSQ